MEENYTIQYRFYSNVENEGIYVFMATPTYREGDVLLKVNCTGALCWTAHKNKLEEFKNIVGDNRIVCAFIIRMIREKNKEQILHLLKIHTAEEVQLMLEILDEFVRAILMENYDMLCT